MILGNLDNKVTEFFGPVGDAIIPFTGFSLGAGIDLANVLKGGVSGIVLGLITIYRRWVHLSVRSFYRQTSGICGLGSSDDRGKCGGGSGSYRYGRPGMGGICRYGHGSGGGFHRIISTARSVYRELVG